MWFETGAFTGLGTDAWLSNYAIGIGSTQFPTGTRLAAGNIQFTENDLSVVSNINASGIATAAQLDLTGSAVANDSVLYLSGAPLGTQSKNGLLGIGQLGFNDTNIIANFTHNVNSYAQVILQNTNSGTNASADFIVNNDRTGGTAYYGDFGINATGFTSTSSPFSDPDGTYLYASGGTLAIGTNDAKDFRIATGSGAATPVTRLTILGTTGLVGLGTTLPSQELDVNGDVRFRGALYDGNNIAGTAGSVLSSTGTGLSWIAPPSSVTGVGIRSDGTTIVGSGATILDFTGPGIATVTSAAGIATITVASEDVFIVPLSDETSNIGTGTSVIAFRAPFPMRIVSIPRANVSTAATQGLVTVDVLVNGTTILGANKLTIDVNEKTSTTAATATTLASNPTNIADDSLIQFDITGIGTGAKGLKVNLLYYKNAN